MIHSLYPFVIRLKEHKETIQRFEIKLDPGASVTGVAIVDSKKSTFLL